MKFVYQEGMVFSTLRFTFRFTIRFSFRTESGSKVHHVLNTCQSVIASAKRWLQAMEDQNAGTEQEWLALMHGRDNPQTCTNWFLNIPEDMMYYRT